ncbi:MAG: hypothetical protein AAF639_16560 [Chloroflexota bacterium]
MKVVQQIVPMPGLHNNQSNIVGSMAAELRRCKARKMAVARAKEMAEDFVKRIPFTWEELIKRGVIDG